MIIDLSGLSGDSLPRERAVSYELRDLPKGGEIFVGPFSGALRLGGTLIEAVTVVGAIVANLTLKAVSSTVLMKIPSPVPNYEGVTDIEITFRFNNTTGRWALESSGDGWFKHRDKLQGELGQWLHQLGDSRAIQLKVEKKLTGWRKGFPLDQLGIARSIHWTVSSSHYMFIGLFPTKESKLTLLLVPSADSPPNLKASPGLRLFGLSDTAFGVNANWSPCPLFLGRQLTDSPQKPWRVIVQWKPFLDKDAYTSTPLNRLRATELLELLWNVPVQNAMAGGRVQKSAQPLIALPVLRLDGDQALLEEIQPLLVFDIPNTSIRAADSKAKLRRVYLLHGTTIPIKAEFGWQAGETSTLPWLKHPDTLLFTGTITDDSPVEAWSAAPVGTAVDAAKWLTRFEVASKTIDSAEQRELVSWKASGKTTRKDGRPHSWITWGALDIRVDAESDDELSCVLRGEWTEDKCDVYPASVLTIQNCHVRVSSASDAAGKNLDAAFGTADEEEDNLQRDAEPIRFPKKSIAEGRACRLRITHHCAPGRNAVTRVEVFSTDRQPLGEDTVVMQMRPFFVGVAKPADLDPEGGELIATWASNDAEGAQWRVPDSTTSLTLQPQAVGESMERGVRFWQFENLGTPEPWIDPANPIKYRFSPPTQLVVRPSVRERRYNKSPGNLAAVLLNAKVESFTTEMVYPVEAKFQVSDQGLPDIRISETASMLGRPAENLEPLPATTKDQTDKSFQRWLRRAYASEAASYACKLDQATQTPLATALRVLRSEQAAAKANFAARLAQHHIFDPWSAQGGLNLKDGVTFRIRSTNEGAPPLANPLPQWTPALNGDEPVALHTDLTAPQKAEIEAFLKHKEWGTLASGSIPAGVVHTMEFASELVAVLRTPTSTRGQIESLAFSALGASGQMRVSFDEGRTTFIAETSFGQLSRLIKVRIGRIGVIWNKAKHVIVYERTTAYTKQFEGEQTYGSAVDGGAKSTLGWPILRKTEEYVEPIETVRRFDAETQKDDNRLGFLAASEFVTPRVYVNGSWGRDLDHGYEIPLWNAQDQSGFYPKPQLALQARAAGTETTRCWLVEPDQLVFYTNTQPNTGDDPDKWQAQVGVDCPRAIARLPLSVPQGKDDAASNALILSSEQMPKPRLGAMRRPRFDLAVESDGKVNLQHARGETLMLASLDVVSIARTSESSQATATELSLPANTALTQLLALAERASKLDAAASLQARASDIVAKAAEQLLRAGSDCDKVKGGLKIKIHELFDSARAETNSALTAFTLPKVDIPETLPFVAAVNSLQRRLLNFERTFRAPIDALLAELYQLRESARSASADHLTGLKENASAQVKSAKSLVIAVVELQNVQLLELCSQAKSVAINGNPEQITSVLDKLVTASDSLEKAVSDGTLQLDDARMACAHALTALQAIASNALVGTMATQIASGVMLIDRFLGDTKDQVDAAWPAVKPGVIALSAALATIAKKINVAGTEAVTQLDAIIATVQALTSDISSAVANASSEVDQATNLTISNALDSAIKKIISIHDATRIAAGLVANDLVAKWIGTVDRSIASLRTEAVKADAELLAVAQNSINVSKTFAATLAAGGAAADNWLKTLENDAIELIVRFDCNEAEKLAALLREKLQHAEGEIRSRLTDQANAMLDGQTRQSLAKLEAEVMATVPKLASQASQAIKLVKAIGELPALPTLTFNASRAEYIFDDFKKQIETSPFAAKLGEIDSGLKQLGIAIPTSQLLDQIIPNSLKGLDFNAVFKNFGAMDFKGLLEKFQLPSLKSEQIKITQGVNKATRSAWVTTKVNADFPEQQSLFEFAGLSVTLAQIKLRADSDMRIALNGDRSSSTAASLTADWGLQFGGAPLAKFRDVAVRFDGSSFKFDIEPSKVELHPALKFVDEFAKRFRPELPPSVEVEKDSRGIPIGARASMVTDIILPPLGIVEIGALKIASGLALRMGEDGQFVVKANVSVGSKTAPVWVQIGYLGGGMWLEATAEYRGSVAYTASVGLAIGCIKAFNVAGVARGSFALLLFAYAEISESGGSLRVGFSMAGSARILGMCNASILLLLEAEHKNGNTEGRGTLDVKVDICWCYTLHVRRDVNHKIN